MLIKYTYEISINHETLTLNKNYIVYAYVECEDKQQYWILNNEQAFIPLFSEHIELLDATHSEQWKTITSSRTGCTYYLPYEWVKEISPEYYNNRMDEVEGFWSSYDDIYGTSCSHMSLTNDCTYIEEMKKEFSGYELREPADLDTTLIGLDIGEGWMMCPECDEAFEANTQEEVLVCPNKACGVVMRNPYSCFNHHTNLQANNI